jgi:diketogulonate reductase-like aldo/keto reductase
VTAVFIAPIDYDHEHDHEMKTVSLPASGRVPVLGQGTWRMGEDKRAHKDEVAALRFGIELGMTLIPDVVSYPTTRKLIGDY